MKRDSKIAWGGTVDGLLKDQMSDHKWKVVTDFARSVALIDATKNGRQDPHIVDEAVQELVLKLHDDEKVNCFCNSGSPSGYLRMMVLNIVADIVRREQRHHRQLRNYSQRMILTRVAPSPEISAIQEEEKQNLDIAIDKLHKRDQSLVRSFYSEGKSIGEIAKLLDQTAGNVTTRLCRLRKRLKKTILRQTELNQSKLQKL